MKHNNGLRMTKADHAYNTDHTMEISPNVVTITVHFIRTIRDLALCERFASSFHHHFKTTKECIDCVCACPYSALTRRRFY